MGVKDEGDGRAQLNEHLGGSGARTMSLYMEKEELRVSSHAETQLGQCESKQHTAQPASARQARPFVISPRVWAVWPAGAIR